MPAHLLTSVCSREKSGSRGEGLPYISPYPGNLEQNGKDFNEEAQKTPDPKSGDLRLGSYDPTEGMLRRPVPAHLLVMWPYRKGKGADIDVPHWGDYT